jgi:hypothetical protein
MTLRVGVISLRLFSVAITSLLVGAGIGFFHGEIISRRWERPAQIAFAEGASSIGALVALVLGPVLYYGLFRRRVSVEEIAIVVSCTAVIGALASITGSEVLIPLLNIGVMIGASFTIMALRKSEANR